MTARAEFSGYQRTYTSNINLSEFSGYYFDAKRNGILLTRDTNEGDITTINTTLTINITGDNSELNGVLSKAQIIGSEYAAIFADNNGGVYIIKGLFLTNITFTRGESESAGSGYELTLYGEDAENNHVDAGNHYAQPAFCRGLINDLVLN